MLLMQKLFTKFASQYQIYTQVQIFAVGGCWAAPFSLIYLELKAADAGAFLALPVVRRCTFLGINPWLGLNHKTHPNINNYGLINGFLNIILHCFILPILRRS